jgi:hypothetical protein
LGEGLGKGQEAWVEGHLLGIEEKLLRQAGALRLGIRLLWVAVVGGAGWGIRLLGLGWRGRWRIGVIAGPGQQHQLHGLLQILSHQAIPPLQSRQGAGSPQGKLLPSMPLDVAAEGLLHQVVDLFPLRLNLGQPLPRQEDAGADLFQFWLVLG